MTPSCKRWSASHRSVTRFNPAPFKVLIVGLSALLSVVSAPSGSTSALEAFVHSISVAYDVLIAKLVDTIPTCDSRVYNYYSLVWMARMMIC